MQSLKCTRPENAPANNLTLAPKTELATKAKGKILSGLIGLISKMFSPGDLNYDSWSKLESHKYCRSHMQDSYQMRFYV